MPEALEVAWRTLVAVVVLFLLTKLLGKRQVTQLSVFEYITGITLGSLAAYVSLDLEANWYLGMISLAVWVAVSLGIEYLQIKSKKARDWIDGQATLLIKDGNILEENLKKERLTADELLQQLRKKNVFKVADVEFAIMEPNGDINILLTKDNQPLTPKDLAIKTAPEHVPHTVIMDGNILDEQLLLAGVNRPWLDAELKKLNVTAEDVYLAQVDTKGKITVDVIDAPNHAGGARPKASSSVQTRSDSAHEAQKKLGVKMNNGKKTK